ncbi:MAG: hypothetical protein NC548_11280 [Lachnospiraceae bacterium]|nr:hypothetical protein [Lachnospiraceae bacterium]
MVLMEKRMLSRYSKEDYCIKCGNSGQDVDGNPCTCKYRVINFYEEVSCIDIPEQYRGITFNKALLPLDMPESYGDYLTDLHDSIIRMRWRHRNVCLCSPVAHGKSVMAYSCIEQLFRKGIPTFPVFDVLEIKRILIDTDLCRKLLYEVNNPEYLTTAPYVFIKIPRVPTWEIYDTAASILDRRVRRDNVTIFLYDGSWEQLIHGDRFNVLAGLQGDGTYNTLDIKSWHSNVSTTDHVIQLDDNIG